MTSFLKGKQAEERALSFFLNQGYACLAQRFKTKWGEIDLIVSRSQELHFVEVKRRTSLSGGLFSLIPKQQGRIYKSALSFLSSCPSVCSWSSFQFDLVVVTPEGAMTHLPNVFMVDDHENIFI
jgi:putative endonuclease